ncbi:LD-carboxypeptidase, partial [Streptomyces sp. NPDC054956]
YTLGDEARRSELVDLYARVLTKAEAPGVLPAAGTWETWRPGRARGPLVGGLLNRLVGLQATPFALPAERFDGAVLFWEEVDRSVSRIWCDLHTLRLSGVLDRIAGMVVGIPSEVTPYEGGGERVGLREVVLDVLADRDIPVLAQVDFGHTSPNLPLPLGVRADVDADGRTLTLLEPAVA